MRFPVRGYRRWGWTGWSSPGGKRPPILRLMREARLYSSSSHDLESFDVTCGSSGFIAVDIYNSHQLTLPTRPLIIYLPPTGVHLRHTHPPIPSILHSHPLAAINYRWNNISAPLKPLSDSSPFTTIPDSHPFPTPLHDTLHAYTWLTTQYRPSLTSQSSNNANLYPTPPPSPQSRSRSPYATESSLKTPLRPIILYGSHLGGTLATSLALTECKTSKNIPVNITGLIVKDGIFNWTAIATSLDPSLHSTLSPSPSPTSNEEASKPWTLSTLYRIRESLFATPAAAFDTFASPTLFFRTPGLTVPKSPYFPGCEPPTPIAPAVDISGLSLSEAEYAALSSAEFDTLPPSSPPSPSSSSPSSPKRPGELEPEPRSSNLKFPPRDSGLRIPRSLFLRTSTPHIPSTPPKHKKRGAGNEDELASQAAEIARLMRRSVVLHEFKDRVLWDEDADAQAASEERVQFRLLGLGQDGEAGGRRGGGGGEEEEGVLGELLDDIGF